MATHTIYKLTSFPVPLFHPLPEFFSHLENKLSIFKILFWGVLPLACWLNVAPENILASTQPDWLLLPQQMGKSVKSENRKSPTTPPVQWETSPTFTLLILHGDVSETACSRGFFCICPQAWESSWFCFNESDMSEKRQPSETRWIWSSILLPLHLSEDYSFENCW